MRIKALLGARAAAAIALLGALIFISAGRLDYWQGWVYIGVNAAVLALSFWLLEGNPGLMSERINPGKGTKWWDKGYFLFSTPLWLAAIVVASVDAGRGLGGPRPAPLAYCAFLALYLAGQALYLWAEKVNPFFSSVARIQTDRGQSVCREGPYARIRHPGYLGGLLFGLASPLILGSYLALIPQALAAVLLVVRTGLEDHMLKKDLLWYMEYTKAVRYRLVPGVW